MVVVPVAAPVNSPVPGAIVAIAVLALLQRPPTTVLLYIVVLPEHRDARPAIVPALGSVVTFIILVTVVDVQLLLTVYMMVSVPGEIPVTIPPLTAAAALLALQIPPGTVFDKVMVEPVHTLEEPVMLPALGAGVILMILVTTAVPQPLVYE